MYCVEMYLWCVANVSLEMIMVVVVGRCHSSPDSRSLYLGGLYDARYDSTMNMSSEVSYLILIKARHGIRMILLFVVV